MRKAFLLLALLACGSKEKSVCTTKCGLVYFGDWPTYQTPYTCSQVQSVEDKTMYEFDFVTDNRFKNSCEAVSGFSLYGNSDPHWIDRLGRDIAGQTLCPERTLQIGDFPSIWDTALAHELAHVVQSCNAILPVDQGLDNDHANWNRDHIYEAVDLVKEQ